MRLEHLRRLAIGRDVDRHLRRKAVRARQRRRAIRRRGSRPKAIGGDLLDARERDHDQRDQQHDAEPEREGRARHEIVAVPEREDDREPGADRIGARPQA